MSCKGSLTKQKVCSKFLKIVHRQEPPFFGFVIMKNVCRSFLKMSKILHWDYPFFALYLS